MKVLIQSYNNCCQNLAGGVRTKIFNYKKSLEAFPDVECKLFNKWEDKMSDYNILHCFALTGEINSQVRFAKSNGLKVILSSIVPLSKPYWVRFNSALGRLLHISNLFYLNKQTLDLTDCIITETEKEKAFICKAYGISPDKIVSIPNGVATDVQGGDPKIVRDKFGFKEDCIVHVSRIDRNKNQLSVIRAMKDTNIPIVFIGGPDPTDMAYFEQCKQEATNNMYFAGWVYHDDPLLASTLAAAKVSVLPSYKETFGNSIYEGLLAGCNVVATNAIPVAEWGLENDVISCNPGSVEDIRACIMKAYEKDRDIKVVEKVDREFSFEAIAKKHIDIYKSVLQ